jgi:hypothetical protein
MHYVTSPYVIFYENDTAPCKLCKHKRENERKTPEEEEEEEEDIVEIEKPNQCDVNERVVDDHMGTATRSNLIESLIGTPMFLFFSDKASVVHKLDPRSPNFPYEIELFGVKCTMHAKSYSTTRNGSHFYSQIKINIDEEVLCQIDNLYDSEIVRLSSDPDFYEAIFNSVDDYDCLICCKKK